MTALLISSLLIQIGNKIGIISCRFPVGQMAFSLLPAFSIPDEQVAALQDSRFFCILQKSKKPEHSLFYTHSTKIP